MIAVKISTTHDTNGNPRRGWLVYMATEDMDTGRSIGYDLIAFVDEGYAGNAALTRAYPLAVTIASLEVTPREYREAKRGQAERECEALAEQRAAGARGCRLPRRVS